MKTKAKVQQGWQSVWKLERQKLHPLQVRTRQRIEGDADNIYTQRRNSRQSAHTNRFLLNFDSQTENCLNSLVSLCH